MRSRISASPLFPGLLLLLGLLMPACTIKTQHQVEVKPIQVTVDVNLKVQKEIEDVYGDIFSASETIKDQAPASSK